MLFDRAYMKVQDFGNPLLGKPAGERVNTGALALG